MEKWYHHITAGPTIVARSKAMQRVMSLVDKIAAWDVNLCLVGENGTAKELLARAIHHASPRRARPFVALECDRSRAVAGEPDRATMAQAETGTLFVDELLALSAGQQAALLGLIQSRQPSRLRAAAAVDVRLIAGTTANLSTLIEGGAVREDLYYRAAAILIQVPPLRERRDDIPVLVEQLLANVARAQARPVKQLTPRALNFVLTYPWPGNEEQLVSSLEQAARLAPKDAIDLELVETACRTPGTSDARWQRSSA